MFEQIETCRVADGALFPARQFLDNVRLFKFLPSARPGTYVKKWIIVL